jgi:hypothetical protein
MASTMPSNCSPYTPVPPVRVRVREPELDLAARAFLSPEQLGFCGSELLRSQKTFFVHRTQCQQAL